MTTTEPLVYAGAVSRGLAYLLDALVISLSSGATAVAMGLVAEVLGTTAREIAATVVAAYVVVLPSLFAVYCALFWGLAGRTLGMALLGLRVITVDGRRVRWAAAWARAVVLAYFPVGSVLILVDGRHQALHDKIARTVVIRFTPTG